MDNILDSAKLRNFSILTDDSKGERQRNDMHSVALGEFARKEQTDFFNEAYGDILFSYFKAWLQTSHEDDKQREYLYNSAMALGSVRQKLADMSMLSDNIRYQNSQKDNESEE